MVLHPQMGRSEFVGGTLLLMICTSLHFCFPSLFPFALISFGCYLYYCISFASISVTPYPLWSLFITVYPLLVRASPLPPPGYGSVVKNLPANVRMQEPWVPSLGQKMSCKRKWQPTLVFLPGKFQGQRSLWLQPTGSQRVGQDWATELQQQSRFAVIYFVLFISCETAEGRVYGCLVIWYTVWTQNSWPFPAKMLLQLPPILVNGSSILTPRSSFFFFNVEH